MSAVTFDPLGPQEMLDSEIEVLVELVRSSRARQILEIGMANGSSTLAMLSVLRHVPDGHLTSIDPYQLLPADRADGMVKGFCGIGVARVRESGFADLHTLIDRPDFVALPELVQQQRRFDLIFIDGYHSFDYVMLDAFYADLILRPGGTLVFHDSVWPAVFRACQFVLHNKPYRLIGPPLALIAPTLMRRVTRRLWHLATGRGQRFRDRRVRWKSVAAFVKEEDRLAAQFSVIGV
jgi:predicted O-methyltransferase YrrM